MNNEMQIPEEGAIYKIIDVENHKFELRYGYNEDFEREKGQPVVLFPDLKKEPKYTDGGHLIVTSLQEPCEHYEPHDSDQFEDWCADCIHYPSVHDEIGICKCKKNMLKNNL